MKYVQTAVSTMTPHIGVASIVSNYLGFLLNLSTHADNKVPLMAVVDSVMFAMVQHAAVSSVAELAIGLLWTLVH